MDTTELAPLIAHSKSLFVFDDLHYITDEKLTALTSTISETINECDGCFCSMLLTSRDTPKVFDNSKMDSIKIEGLSNQEAILLLNNLWQLSLTEEQLKRVLVTFGNHPQFLQFFYQWYLEVKLDSAKLDSYLIHASKEKKLEDYLMNQLYLAFGGKTSEKNKMLKAVSFFRIPETESFVKHLFEHLDGEDFSDTFYEMKNKRGLIKELFDVNRFDVHDLLRDFYYRKTENKITLHEKAAHQYQKRGENAPEIINPIFGAHHFRKANKHEAAAQIIEPITHYCITRGLYWFEINHTLERINLEKIQNEELRFRTVYNRGNLHLQKGDWDFAGNDFLWCLKIDSQNKNFHVVPIENHKTLIKLNLHLCHL